jgi:hypothetical protein
MQTFIQIMAGWIYKCVEWYLALSATCATLYLVSVLFCCEHFPLPLHSHENPDVLGQVQWLMPVIIATWEVEIKRISV